MLFSIVAQRRMLQTVPQRIYDGAGQFVPSLGRFWQRCGDGNELLHLPEEIRSSIVAASINNWFPYHHLFVIDRFTLGQSYLK